MHPEIMEERYEIRGKIGQGGLGAVYRGYDTRMNREVAIKRISVSTDDPALEEESTRQLIKEAGALASLQHPHIVTIYDVGTDSDGPFVVMELINGKTLDELIEHAPLTWNDFRELALQANEALIAAQELDLIHSDLKPSNLMLTWLPSGKFQIKVVDFGLATLTQSQSLEELQEIESVFGSIFFMAPEQFERVPIDARTDMYAMGCVYYQALTGNYPFMGETGHEVMLSHLHHRVIPIQEVRSDIPLWACDWIMWHLNRLPDDRPESARQALHVFLQNDQIQNPTLSLGRAQPAIPAGPRPRLAIPSAGTFPGTKRRIAGPPQISQPAPAAIPEPPQTTTAPQPLMPPEGFKPSVHTVPVIAEPPPPAPAPPVARPVAPTRYVPPPKPASSGGTVKVLLILVLCGIAAVLAMKFLNSRQAPAPVTGDQRYSLILAAANQPGTTGIPMTGADLKHFLQEAASEALEKRQAAFKVLTLAKPTDTSDFDATIAMFATTYPQLPSDVRSEFIREVIAKRMTPAQVPELIDFARRTSDGKAAAAALTAIAAGAGDAQFETLLSVVQYHPGIEVRDAAAATARTIFQRSKQREILQPQIGKALASATDPEVRKLLEQMK